MSPSLQRAITDDYVSDATNSGLPTIAPKMAELLAFTQKNHSSITPKEINATLAQVLQSYDELTAMYAHNSQRIDSELAHVRKTGGDVSGRLHQLHVDVQQQQNALVTLKAETDASVLSVHTELHGQLAHRDGLWDSKLGDLHGYLEKDIGALDVRMGSLQVLFAAQEHLLTEQATRLDQFGVAQELLDTATRGNRNRIEGLREMAERQHAITKAQIEGLRALQREHYTEFQSVQSLLGVLQHEMHRLVRTLQDVSVGLDTHVAHTHYRFRWTHAAMVAMMVLTVAGFSLFKWAPTFAPVTTSQAVKQLDHRVSGISTQVADLAPLQGVAAEHEVKVVQISGQVARLEKSLTDLRNSVQTLRTLQLASGPSSVNGFPAHDGQWLLNQSPKAFTVQLMGVPDPTDVTRFIASNPGQFNEGGLAYSVTERDQQARFNLFYGIFTNASQARAAINALPADIRANKPWVRQLRSVHDSIK